jgi:hypothetical protein
MNKEEVEQIESLGTEEPLPYVCLNCENEYECHKCYDGIPSDIGAMRDSLRNAYAKISCYNRFIKFVLELLRKNKEKAK